MNSKTKIIIRILLIFLFFISFCTGKSPAQEQGTLNYTDSPRKIIFQINTTGGITSPIAEKTRMPEFTLYGDGRAVYTRVDQRGNVQLLDTRLSQDEMDFVLGFISNEGFMECNDNFYNITVEDLETTYITLYLKEQEKTVKIYGTSVAIQTGQLPRGLANIYKKFSNFSDENEKDYEPDKISLFVSEVPAEVPEGGKVIKWKVGKLDLPQYSEEKDSLLVKYKETVFQGEDRKNLVNFLKGKTLFENRVGFSQTFFKSHGRLFKVAYKPHLPYE